MYSQAKKYDFNWNPKRKRAIMSSVYLQPPEQIVHSNHKHMSPIDVIKEYCQETTLHGIRYTMRENATFFDRLSWVVILVVCAIFAGLFVNDALVKYHHSPTVTSVETTHFPLYMVPFPAITICPATKINKIRGLDILKEYLEVTSLNSSMETELEHLMSAMSMLQHPFYDRMASHLAAVPHLERFDELNITWFMLAVLPRCKDLFSQCFWLGRGKNCCDIFRLQRSENGFCYSFNSLTSETAKVCPAREEVESDAGETGKPPLTNKECMVHSNTGAGTTTGLEVFLYPAKQDSQLRTGQRDMNGARVLIHHPLQFPEAGKGLFMPEATGDVFTIKVSPSLTVTSPEVRNLDPSERNCIFSDEVKLTIYHTYTQQACLTECRLKFIAQECQCAPYYFDINHEQIPECTVRQFWCITNHSQDLRFFRPPDGTRGFTEWSSLNCLHCMPTCYETVYNLESSLSRDNNPALNKSTGYLDVYYKDLGVVKYRRTPMFDKMQLLVSFGGIASLFLGVSLLTVVEVSYYGVKLMIACFYRVTSKHPDVNKPQHHWYPSEIAPSGFLVQQRSLYRLTRRPLRLIVKSKD